MLRISGAVGKTVHAFLMTIRIGDRVLDQDMGKALQANRERLGVTGNDRTRKVLHREYGGPWYAVGCGRRWLTQGPPPLRLLSTGRRHRRFNATNITNRKHRRAAPRKGLGQHPTLPKALESPETPSSTVCAASCVNRTSGVAGRRDGATINYETIREAGGWERGT